MLQLLSNNILIKVYAELAPMRASSCLGIVNLWQGQIPKQLVSIKTNINQKQMSTENTQLNPTEPSITQPNPTQLNSTQWLSH